MHPIRYFVVLLLGVLTACGVAAAPAAAWELDRWTLPPAQYAVSKTRNARIQLDDGRTLRADIYTPADRATGRALPGPFPVIVGLTPFGKTSAADGAQRGENGLNLQLVRRGYIAAVVDVPGTGGSEGAFNLFDRAEALAGRQVVTWASQLPRSTGTVGMLGLSYTAIVQLFTAAEVGPGSPLKAIFPMAASVDPYRDLFVSGGALNTASPIGLLFGYGGTRSISPWVELWDDLPRALRYAQANVHQLRAFEGRFAGDMLRNGPLRYDSDYWAERRPQRLLERIVAGGVATFLVGGLKDVFQRGQPLLYSGLQNAAAGRDVRAPMLPGQPVDGRFQLLTGPWNHAQIGQGIDLSAIQLAWFDRWLKGTPNGIEQTTTPLHVLEPGGARYDAATYPLADARVMRLHLRSERRLLPEPPSGPEPGELLHYTGINDLCSGSTEAFTAGNFVPLMQQLGCWPTQRKPLAGPGAATYATPPLQQPLRLAGPIGVTLRAGSTHRETMWSVTIEDVAPSGRSTDITGGAQLGSLRSVDPQRSWPAPGGDGWLMPHHELTAASRRTVPRGLARAERYDIEVRAAFATIPAGHRLRVRVETADVPHVIPLADLPNLAGGRYRIHHSAAAPSFVDISVR